MHAVAEIIAPAKSPQAFRTISEVAIELDVPQHVLRFWESRFTQVRPVKRAGGRRYYRPEDVELLRGIRALLYSEGYTIKGVQKVLRERGLRFVAEGGRGKVRPPASEAPTAAILRLERSEPSLVEEEREKLEILLAELLQLKARLRAAHRAA
jgi:DNA-binding transcriptional MerR regulator